MIWVSSYFEIDELAATVRFRWMISILGPKDCMPWPTLVPAERRLRLGFDDTKLIAGGPKAGHIRDLIAFLRRWDMEGPLLIHCRGGIARSTAAALIALVVFNPGRERWAANLLRDNGPHAQPSPEMIALADRELRLGGRLAAAAQAMPPADWTRHAIISLPVRIAD